MTMRCHYFSDNALSLNGAQTVPTILAGDNVLVTINGSLFSQRIMSTFGYVVSAVTGSIQDSDAFGSLRDKMCAAGELVDKYMACLPDDYVKGDIWFQVIRPTRYRKVSLANTAAGAKSGYSASTPNMAITILRRGDIANRKNISTLHVPAPVTADWISDGLLTVEALTAGGALATKIKADITTSTNVVTYSPSILNGPTASDVTPITEASVEDTARVMRRRTVRVGI